MSPLSDWLQETYATLDFSDPHIWFTLLCLVLFVIALRIEQKTGWFSEQDTPYKSKNNERTSKPSEKQTNIVLPRPEKPKMSGKSPFAIPDDLVLDPPKNDLYTPEQLKLFDGSDPAKPIYVAIKGTIFDVSRKPEMYGQGSGYNVFAGKDASKGLGMSSLDPANAVPDYSALDEKDRKTLESWYTFFEKRYNIVGKVKS